MTSNSDYRFYIVGTGNDYIKFMWKDAIENDNVFYLENPMSAKFPLRDLYNSIDGIYMDLKKFLLENQKQKKS